jgi:hypothetical protein
MLWFIYLAKLRTDLLDNRSLAILLETYKLLICYTLVFGQPLSLDPEQRKAPTGILPCPKTPAPARNLTLILD